MTKQALNAIDLFSGCGGLSAGMVQAGFNSKVSIEIDKYAVLAYRMNHPETIVIENDIRKVSSDDIIAALNGEPLHLLAGCPPCQGFSSVRRLNRKQNVRDDRNALILEYLRFVKELKPLTIMMENVPGLINYYLFEYVVKELDELGYSPKVKIVNVKDYGVPQNRRRLIMVGSMLGEIDIAEGTREKVTVKG